MKRALSSAAVPIVLILGVATALAQVPAPSRPTGMKALLAGNHEFVVGPAAERRRELAPLQHPSAMVLGCSDSRVPPELVFHQGLGDLFVVRTAGNVADAVALGSLEYGAGELHVPLLVILGHDGCGAVSATLAAKGPGSPNLDAIVDRIAPAAKVARAAGGTSEQILERAVVENVHEVHRSLLAQSPALQKLVDEKKLQIVEAVYHLDTGEISVY